MDETTIKQLIAELRAIRDELKIANTLRAISTPAPNIELPIEQFNKFDLSSIGARVVASDADGWTAIAWGMRVFFRRRSSDDDEKGQAIRFTRCIGGSAQAGDQKWETLIRFRERRPVKKLNEELRARVAAPSPAIPSASASPSAPAPALVVSMKQETTAAQRREHALAAWQEAARKARELGLISSIEAHRAKNFDTTDTLIDKASAINTAIADHLARSISV